MLIDTHAHVHFAAYKEDMHEVITRALQQDVHMITVGTQKDTSQKAIETAERYEGVFAAIGLHPNHLHKQAFFDENELGASSSATPKIHTRQERFDGDLYRSMARHPKVVAIGECGFDFYRLPEGVEVSDARVIQEEAVRAQFDLATKVEKPVIIHCRDGHADQVRVIEEYLKAGKLTRRGVVHCFTGTREEAEKYHALGFLTSFTGIITFPPRKHEGAISPLQEVVRDLPLSMMMVETDAPYLTPVPHRSERNEPAYVRFVAQKIAELKGISFEEVAEVTTANAKRLFGI